MDGTTTVGQGGPESNGNERLLQTPKSSWSGFSPSDAIYCNN